MGRNRWGLACGLAAATLTVGPSAEAAVPHEVQPGETLWSIAAASNFTTRTVAAFNGLPEDAEVVAGTTIQIPSAEEGAAALATAGIEPGATSTTPAPAADPDPAPAPASSDGPPPPAPGSTYGLGHILSPSGELHLDPAAAGSWNAMRAEAMSTYGVDLHPAGPVSAFRTHDQQAYLYDLFLSGAGAPANPPGSSSHEVGSAVDLATPEMRSVLDAIGPAYGWHAPHSNEWWHVEYWG
ncbi:MAG: LysM peptidoglycan-binding domain-containing protein [Solirubrobacterales bacterium]